MRRNDLARKIACWITLGAFSLQPSLAFAADIVADASAPEAQRPYVTETASGVPLVQIARPDGGDVSVNRYEAFSVPERGAILNNAFLFSNTQLAGYIEGNPNLSGGPARIIVNEVMSDRPSELRGFLEVAGTKADVIIANGKSSSSATKSLELSLTSALGISGGIKKVVFLCNLDEEVTE